VIGASAEEMGRKLKQRFEKQKQRREVETGVLR
jgi:hypothetical protein